jgi:DNA ligase (NAD+)
MYEVAYKFTEEVEFSKLLDVTFNVGLFGRLAPIAHVKPVKLKGNTIENISLGSIGRVNDLKLHKGDKIKVLYDIIPYLSFDDECEHNYDGEEITIPDECPECGELLEFTDSMDIAYCANKDCPCRIKGKILNYLSKMKIYGISYGIIDKLFTYDFVTCIEDLYSIEKNAKRIIGLDGFGSKSVKSWIESINNKRTVQDYVLLGSLGIEGISKKTFEKIMTEMTIDEMLDAVEENKISSFVKIPTIQEKTAQKLMDGIKENKKLIKFLEKELTIVQSKGMINKGKYSVCFTKIRDDDKEKYIISTGGIVSDSLTKNTTFLVVPSLDTESSKVARAKKYGVKIVPIDDLESTIANYLKELEFNSQEHELLEILNIIEKTR